MELRCYARGRGQKWEAFCVDLDLAVEARSLVDAIRLLEQAIGTYVEDAMKESPEVCRKLLNRKAPLLVRLRWRLGSLLHTLRNGSTDEGDARFVVPCRA